MNDYSLVAIPKPTPHTKRWRDMNFELPTAAKVVLYLKNKKHPIKISLPVLDIDEDDLIRIIDREIKKHLYND